MDLPEDLTLDILMRLPVKSLCAIQCASKASLNIAGSPGFATLHTLRLLDSATNSGIVESPQLMLLAESMKSNGDHEIMLQSFKYNGGKYALEKTRQSALVSKVCFRSFYYDVDFVFCNLFCFRRGYGGPWFLVNPLRGEVLKLPISNIQVPTGAYGKDWYGMGFDNITSTYKIVHVLAKAECNYLVAQVLVLGASSWRQIHLVPPCDVSSIFFGRRPSKNAIYACGGMHWLIYSHIISFDFNKEKFYVTPHPNLEGRRHPYRLRLLNLRGSLALVNFSDGYNIEIWVLKSSNDKKKWELHHQIKEKDVEFNPHFVDYTMTCAAWEHGICFASPQVCYFLDLRHPLMKKVQLPTLAPSIFSHNFWRGDRYMNCTIFSYTESLISLKNYGTLIEATDSKEGVWHFGSSIATFLY